LVFCHTQYQPLIRQTKPQGGKIVFTERADDLFSDAKEHGNGKKYEVDVSNGDFFKTVQNDLKSEETGPPIHEELAKIVTRLVRRHVRRMAAIKDKQIFAAEKLRRFKQSSS